MRCVPRAAIREGAPSRRRRSSGAAARRSAEAAALRRASTAAPRQHSGCAHAHFAAGRANRTAPLSLRAARSAASGGGRRGAAPATAKRRQKSFFGVEQPSSLMTCGHSCAQAADCSHGLRQAGGTRVLAFAPVAARLAQDAVGGRAGRLLHAPHCRVAAASAVSVRFRLRLGREAEACVGRPRLSWRPRVKQALARHGKRHTAYTRVRTATMHWIAVRMSSRFAV